MKKTILLLLVALAALFAVATPASAAPAPCATVPGFGGGLPASCQTTTTEAPVPTTEAPTTTTEAPTTTTEAPVPTLPQVPFEAPTTTTINFVVPDPDPVAPAETTTTVAPVAVPQATVRMDCSAGGIVTDVANLGDAGTTITVTVDGVTVAESWLAGGDANQFVTDLGPADEGKTIHVTVTADEGTTYDGDITVDCVADAGCALTTATSAAFDRQSNNEGAHAAVGAGAGSGNCQVQCWFVGAALALGLLARKSNMERIRSYTTTRKGKVIVLAGFAGVATAMTIHPWITMLVGAVAVAAAATIRTVRTA